MQQTSTRLPWILGLSCALTGALAQSVITTVAGTDWLYPGGELRALEAPLGAIPGMAGDRQGNLYFADVSNRMFMRLSPSGIITVVAGNGLVGPSGEEVGATRAPINLAKDVALDGQGNLYLSDTERIRRITSNGTIVTVAGNGLLGFSGDGGSAPNAGLNRPAGIAVDGRGNLYIADFFNHRIRMVSPDAIITTIAGTGQPGSSGSGGPARAALLDHPIDVAADSDGNVYISDAAGIRRVTPAGVLTTIVPNVFADQLAVDSTGRLLYSDPGRHQVYRVEANGQQVLVAGNGTAGYSGDGGPATAASLNNPSGLMVDSAGNVYIGDFNNQRIRRVTPTGTMQTIAGNGRFRFSPDGIAATSATLNNPRSVAVDSRGNLYVSESDSHRVRRVAPNGTIATFAGTGQAGFSGDGGLAVNATLNSPFGIAVDGTDRLYIADGLNNRIRRVNSDGTITTIAGGGQAPLEGAAAAAAAMSTVRYLAVDTAGLLYFEQGTRIFRVGQDGRVARVAGTQDGEPGFSGDGGPAINARINTNGIVLDRAGNLYFADGINHRVRRVDPQGIIRTFAGTGAFGFSGDGGPAVNAMLWQPASVHTDAVGNLYIADLTNYRLRRVSPSGTITTVAGAGTSLPFADGVLSTRSFLDNALASASDGAGNLYIVEGNSHRVRKVLIQPPSLLLSADSLEFSANSDGPLPAVQRFTVLASTPGVEFQASSDASWLQLSIGAGTAPRQIEVRADPTALAQGEYRGLVIVDAPLSVPSRLILPVTFRVGAGLPPNAKLDKASLTFTFPKTAVRRSERLTISNAGGGSLDFQVMTATTDGGTWLAVSPAQGRVTPRQPSFLDIAVNPASLSRGTYTGTVTILAGQQSLSIPIVVTVSGRETGMLLSQSGLSFTTVSGGGMAPPQTFGVLNIGNGSMPWTVSTSTLSGGPGWLSATPSAGRTDAAIPAVPLIEVRVNQDGLSPGRYFGLVQVDSNESANTPQVVTIMLDVLRTDEKPGAVIQPAELVFEGPPGSVPASQDLLVYNLDATPISFRSSSREAIHLPRDATVQPRNPVRVVVQPAFPLPPVTVTGSLGFQFADGTAREVKVRFLGLRSPPSAARSANGCTPTKLNPVLLTVGQASLVPAGAPAGIAIVVKDDCGQPMTGGSVLTFFSNGDTPLALQSLKDGRWDGTWQNRSADRRQVSVRFEAEEPSLALKGTLEVNADVRDSPNAPRITTEGVVSSATPLPFTPIGPGGLISIYGEHLTEGAVESAPAPPLPDRLADAQVVMAGRGIPLLFASPRQINALVPYDLELNTLHQVLIRRGRTLSKPAPVSLAPAQPGIFVTPQGRAIAVAVRGADRSLVTPDFPAQKGDVLVIYSAGLGLVLPELVAGVAAPVDVLRRTREAVQVRIGGTEAPVSFAGLTPGFIGLYQVNALVPEDAPSGIEVPITLQVAGQSSPAAGIAIR